MEITVIAEEENPMLHRTDVQFRVSHAEATPDRLAVRDSLAARLNKDADEVVVRRLDTKFGMRETVGEAKVYQGAEFATDVEQEHMLARNKIGDAGMVEEDAEPDAEGESADAEADVEEEPAAEEAADAEDEPPAEPAEEPAAEDEAEPADDEEVADDDAEAADEDADGDDDEEA